MPNVSGMGRLTLHFRLSIQAGSTRRRLLACAQEQEPYAHDGFPLPGIRTFGGMF